MPSLSTYLLCVTHGKLSQRATTGLQVATVCVWACMYLCEMYTIERIIFIHTLLLQIASHIKNLAIVL